MSPEGFPQPSSSEEQKKQESIGKRAENYRDDQESIAKKVTSIRQSDENLTKRLEARGEKMKNKQEDGDDSDLKKAA